MTVVNMHEAKTHLSRLVQRAVAGEEIIIGKAGEPLVRLVPYTDVPVPLRTPGRWKGLGWISPDFDDDLPAEMLAAFNGDDE